MQTSMQKARIDIDAEQGRGGNSDSVLDHGERKKTGVRTPVSSTVSADRSAPRAST
jgi:hypothetical protein